MRSSSTHAGASAGTPAPLNLSLAVRRLALRAESRHVTAIGAHSFDFGDEIELTQVPDAADVTAEVARDGVVVLTGAADWSRLEHGRIVVSASLDSAEPAADAVESARAAATTAGWHVVFTGLLHTGGAGGSRRHESGLLVACRPGDELAPALDNGPLSLALDPATVAAGGSPRPARVLIASYEIAGPTGNGGIGTAYHSLAHVLAAAGHHVTLLFTGWLDPAQAQHEQEWRDRFAAAGIEFELLGTPWDTPVRNPHHQVRRAYELHRWLSEAQTRRPFDVVHLPETLGHGAFALTAKRLGYTYRDLEFVVGTHSSTRWVAESNREGIEDLDPLVTEQLERISVELADVVISPTAYMLDYMRDRDWTLPERTFVQPLARPQAVRRLASDEAGAARARAGVRELVFFGRLETRKGLEAFCDAVDLLAADDRSPFTQVTFLGRPERVLGEPAEQYIEHRAAEWGVDVSIVPDLGHAEAVAYLREHQCVVAIPSLVDNSPNTVIEAVALGVPFVASRSGGTGELIATGDLADATFDGWSETSTLEPPTFADVQDPFDVHNLADALRARAEGTAAAPSPAVTDADCDRVYDEWHRAIAGRTRAPRPEPSTAPPTTAVCIVARDGSGAARVADEVKRGTRTPTQIAAIIERASDAPLDGVDVTVARGRATGPARRRVNAASDADVLIVLRDNERPDPMLVEQVTRAFDASDADVLTLVTRDPDSGRPTGTPEHLRRAHPPRDLRAFVPVPGPALAGALYPALSVGPYAIRRSALAALGGYASDCWGETVDRDLLTRASLAGLRIDVLPEPLATVVDDDAWTDVRSRHWGYAPVPAPAGEDEIRLLRPFRRELAGELAELPALLVGTLRAANDAVAKSVQLAHDRDAVATTYEQRIGEYNELVEDYERRLTEHRDLIALYEDQKAELTAALNARGDRPDPAAPGRTLVWRARGRLRRATRGPVRGWPMRGVRFARWRIVLLRRRLR